jgi:hypothetical protein
LRAEFTLRREFCLYPREPKHPGRLAALLPLKSLHRLPGVLVWY